MKIEVQIQLASKRECGNEARHFTSDVVNEDGKKTWQETLLYSECFQRFGLFIQTIQRSVNALLRLKENIFKQHDCEVALLLLLKTVLNLLEIVNLLDSCCGQSLPPFLE